MRSTILFLFSTLIVSSANTVVAAEPRPFEDKSLIKTFIDEMVAEYKYDYNFLTELFDKARLHQSILDAISRPAESKPWYDYRKIFVTRERVRGGVLFWNEHEDVIKKVADKYQVRPDLPFVPGLEAAASSQASPAARRSTPRRPGPYMPGDRRTRSSQELSDAHSVSSFSAATRGFDMRLSGFTGEGDNNLVILDYDTPTGVTSDNFLGHFVYGLDSRHVETVICKGKVIVENRRMVNVDEGEVLAFAREMGKKLWQKM